MSESSEPIITSLRPAEKPRVMDLVEEAGIDVADWKGSAAGAANPKYCYNWSFVDRESVVVLCLWHNELESIDGKIVQRLNYKQYAEAGANSMRNARADKMDVAFQVAFNRGLPVRVIIVDGVRRGESDAKSSEVARRMLDGEVWAVASYEEESGACVLVRGEMPRKFVDQHILSVEKSSLPKKRASFVQSFSRNPRVRMHALRRSLGVCEFCNDPGFKMSDGRIYLETHHIVPLSDGGADSTDNVIALCPNHHREAHFGDRADLMKVEFTAILERKEAHGVGL